MPTFDGKSEKNSTVGLSAPKKSQNPQSAYRRRQNKLFTISYAWRCAADAQNHQQPEPRESGKNPDSVL